MSTSPFYIKENPQPSGQSAEGRDPRSRQLDELQRKSQEHRDKELGSDWFSEVNDFYYLEDAKQPAPTFRPKVLVPQLQVLMLNEAVDLSDADPKVYILDKKTRKRDEDRENAFMSMWREGFFSNRIMQATIWALFSCIGYIQVGFDADAEAGTGALWLKALDPARVYPDPAATSDDDWSYVVVEDKLYIDAIESKWANGQLVRAKHAPKVLGNQSGAGNQFQMPAGPMSVTPGLGQGSPIINDDQYTVRYAFVKDATIEDIPTDERRKADGLLDVVPDKRPKYPNGRLIIDCEGVVLFDDNNPYPGFPIVRFLGMPALKGFYAPPPTRYTQSLQSLAERMFTQTFENAVRLNNGIVLIEENSGITLDEFGGIPAEVHIVSGQGQNPVRIITPPAFPQHMLQMPQMLLELQRTLQGFTPARSGEPGAGNISSDLFDMSVQQSQKLTKLRGRLLTESINKLMKLVFAIAARMFKDKFFPEAVNEEGITDNQWTNISDKWQQYDLILDKNSVQAMSGQILRQMVPTLKQLGLLDDESALEMLGVPDGKAIAQKLADMRKIQMLTAVMQPRKR